MLLHAPWGGEEGRKNNWEALATAQKEGWVKDIGVSNLCVSLSLSNRVPVVGRLADGLHSGVRHLEALPHPLPALNQIELHPWCQQRPIVEYCQAHGIAIEAYSPLARAQPEKWNDPVIQKLCKKHGKSEGQIVLRWGLQKG